jgi:hypothetical protein
VGVGFRVPHRRREAIDIFGAEPMLGAFRLRVDLSDGNAQFIGKIQLPEPVRAHHVQGHALAFAGQPETIALGSNQAFTPEPLQ